MAAVPSTGSPAFGDAPWCREGTTPSLWGHASPIRCSQGDIRGDHPFFRAPQPSRARLGALLHAGGLSPTHHVPLADGPARRNLLHARRRLRVAASLRHLPAHALGGRGRQGVPRGRAAPSVSTSPPGTVTAMSPLSLLWGQGIPQTFTLPARGGLSAGFLLSPGAKVPGSPHPPLSLLPGGAGASLPR